MSDAPFGELHYAASVQCDLRAWRSAREPAPPAPPDPADRELREAFRSALAPVLELEGRPPERAEWQKLERGEVSALLDVGIEARGCQARIDALVRVERDARIEIDPVVLVGARGSSEMVWDRAAFQLATLRAAALPLPLGRLLRMELDPRHVRGARGRAVRWRSRDISGEVSLLADEVPDRIEAARAVTKGDRPTIPPGPHCRRPAPCPLIESCTEQSSTDAVWRLPRLSPALFVELDERGIVRIQDIPDELLSSPVQRRAQMAHRARALYCDRGLSAALAPLGPPTSYLDVEYVIPAVPWFDGMRPYTPIPYQWSLHQLPASGVLPESPSEVVSGDASRAVTHRAFLAEDPALDPRPEFLRTLLESLGATSEPVLVYSGAEAELLVALEQSHPEHATGLAALRARLVDLQAVLLAHVYHPGFGGSFGLKRVAAAFAGTDPYRDLEQVSDGAAAASALWELARTRPSAARGGVLRTSLLAYCQRDSEALVNLHAALRAAARTA